MKIKEKKEDLLANIIYDLKTPTNAQITALESFLKTSGKKINSEEKDLIELTLNSCLHVQKLIDNFSSAYRLNFENLKLNYEKFDIVNMINTIIKEADILLKYSQLNVDFNLKDEIIIYADKAQVQKGIENILYNSINHVFKDSTIEIAISKEKNYLIFQTKSKSPYIEPQILKEIFDKYKTHNTNYNKTIVNLGLYLSKEIICAHFGKMIAKSFDDNTNILGFSIPIK